MDNRPKNRQNVENEQKSACFSHLIAILYYIAILLNTVLQYNIKLQKKMQFVCNFCQLIPAFFQFFGQFWSKSMTSAPPKSGLD